MRKTHLLAAVAVLAIVLVFAAAAAAETRDGVLEKVRAMLAAEISEPIILKWLAGSGERPRHPSAEELIGLKRAGASDELLAKLLDLAAQTPPAEPDPVAAAPAEPAPVAAPRAAAEVSPPLAGAAPGPRSDAVNQLTQQRAARLGKAHVLSSERKGKKGSDEAQRDAIHRLGHIHRLSGLPLPPELRDRDSPRTVSLARYARKPRRGYIPKPRVSWRAAPRHPGLGGDRIRTLKGFYNGFPPSVYTTPSGLGSRWSPDPG